jgi:hypothetical protein
MPGEDRRRLVGVQPESLARRDHLVVGDRGEPFRERG